MSNDEATPTPDDASTGAGTPDTNRSNTGLQQEVRSAAAASLHALETIGMAAAVVDAEGVVREANRPFAALAGRLEQDLIGSDIESVMFGLLVEDTDGGVQEQLAETVTESQWETQFSEPVRIVLPNGLMRWVIPHVSNVMLKDGTVAGRLLALRDITKLMQTQIQLEESAVKYRDLVEMANIIILRVDPDYTLQFINEYARRFFRCGADQVEGANMLDLFVPAADPEGTNQHTFARTVADEPELHGSFDMYCLPGGIPAWVHWSVRAVRDENGRVEGLLYVGSDVTQRKQAELEAAHYRKRSRQLTDQLIHAEEQERARIANKLHDNIIQLISLSNIRLGGVGQDLPEADDVLAGRIEGIRTLLGEAAGECRHIMEQLVPALLHELGLGAALRHLAERHHALDGVPIEVDDQLGNTAIPSELAATLYRGLRELLMNALKYAGSCRISIRVWFEDGNLHAKVADDGKGFDARRLEDAYYTEEGGFGLFALRERVENLGGRLEIQSAPGQGTVAQLSVPFAP